MNSRTNISLYVLVSLFVFACGSSGERATAEDEADLPSIQASNSSITLYEKNVFSLNWLANIMYGVDTTYDVLSASAPLLIDSVLKSPNVTTQIGEWETVWGPVIYSANSQTCGNDCVVDNLLVLFKSKADPTNFVLSTSGTNDISQYGWFEEDFDAYSLVEWPDVANAKTLDDFHSQLSQATTTTSDNVKAVSLGTSVGLSRLLNMNDGGVDLITALTDSVGGASNTLAVAGHSLGGALSPSLALALAQYQTEWDPESKVKIEAHPTAGASPGNALFHSYFFDNFNSNFYGKMNMLDLVPHAWQKDILLDVKKLYGDSLKTGLILDFVVDRVNCKLRKMKPSHPYVSLYATSITAQPDTARSFPGTFNRAVVNDINEKVVNAILNCCKGSDKDKCITKIDPFLEWVLKHSVWDNFACEDLAVTLRFLAEAGYQHTTAYVVEYDVEFMATTMSDTKVKMKLDSTDTKATFATTKQKLEAYLKNLLICI